MNKAIATGANDERSRRFLTAAEVARILTISQRTVWRLVSAKKLPPPRKFGGSRRWISTDIQGWIDNGCPDQNGDQE